MKQKTLRALVEKTYAEAVAAAEQEAQHNTILAIAKSLVDNCQGQIRVGYITYQLTVWEDDSVHIEPFGALNGEQFVQHYMLDILLTLKKCGVNTFDVVKTVDKAAIRKCIFKQHQNSKPVQISANHKRNSANIRVRLEEEDELPSLGGNKYLLEGRNKIGNLVEARRSHIAHTDDYETHYFTRQDQIKCKYKAARKSKRALRNIYYDSIESEILYSDSLAAAEWDKYCEENIVESYHDEEPISKVSNIESATMIVPHPVVSGAEKIGEFYLDPHDTSSKVNVYWASPTHEKAEKIRNKLRSLCDKNDEELIAIFNALSIFNLDK